jgi:hypothetical protein
MDQFLQPLVTNLFDALIVALAGVLVFALKQGIGLGMEYLKMKLGLDQLNLLKQQAAAIVRWLEQSPIFKDFDGPAKKERAIIEFVQWANAHGLPVTHDEIEKLIEEAVQMMNAEIGPIFEARELAFGLPDEGVALPVE